jgi:hypothetical protein
VAAGVPFPTFFVTDHDMTNVSGPPIPGLDRVQCRPLTVHDGISTARSVVRLARLALELVP